MDNERHTLEAETAQAATAVGGPSAALGYGQPPFSGVVADCKIAVLRATLGIRALTDANLLNRLEELYFKGVKAGYELRL